METWTVARRYRAHKCVPRGTNLGGTAEGSAFRPNVGAKALFCCPVSLIIPF